MARTKRNMQVYIVTALIVGGTLLFAYCLFLVGWFIYWIATNPRVLAYAFGVVVTMQGSWLVFSWVKRRFHTPGPDAAIKPPARRVSESG